MHTFGTFTRTVIAAAGVMLVITLLWPGIANAQQAVIEGTVTREATGDPLPGANVLVRGTNLGAATDVQGSYRIVVPAAQVTGASVVLEAKFVGYITRTSTITLTSGSHTVDFALVEDVIGLEDVVVTALGITREERSLGYAVQRVDGDGLVRSAQTSLANALRGQAAGLNIISSSGQPGSASRIELRGVSSLTGNNAPLWVIDGVVVSGDMMDVENDHGYESRLFTGGGASRAVDIDPNIIQDVTILKGASATALYGSRAANGAIIITTKGALSDAVAPRVSVRSRVGWENWHGEGFQSEYLQGLNGLFRHGDPENPFVDPRHPEGTAARTSVSWGPHKDSLDQVALDAWRAYSGLDFVPTFDNRDNFYRTGVTVENSFSITGGVPGINYYLAFTNLDQGGIIPNTHLKRTSVSARFGGQLHPRLRLSTSVNYANTDNQWMGEGNGARAVLWGLNFSPINLDLRDYLLSDGVTPRTQLDTFGNPHWVVRNNRYTSDVDRVIGSVEAEYSILPWLSVAERVSFDTFTDTRKEEINRGSAGRVAGSMFDLTSKTNEINNDITLQMNFPLSSDLRLNALVGNNVNVRHWKWERIRGIGLNSAGFFHVSNANTIVGDDYREQRRLIGVYGQATLDYRDYLYLTLTGRNDWSSTLPVENNSYFYPSASVGFVFTEAFSETFRNSFISYGRLRGAISQVGNDANPYNLMTNYEATGITDGVRGEILFPFQGIRAFTLDNVFGNPDLKPELTTEYEIGIDLRLLRGRARIDFAYYDRSTKDQIFNVPVSVATGYTSKIVNAGEIRNSGVELTVGGTPIQTRDFSWNLNVNFSKNTTEVVELAEGVESIFLGGFTDPHIRATEGKGNYGIIYGNRYARNEDGQVLVGDNGLGIIDSELGAIGNVLPDWLANVRSTIRYKGLELSALLDIREGGDIMNMDLFYTTFYGTAAHTANRGTMFIVPGVNATTGQPNDIEIVRDGLYYRNHYGNVFENFVEDGSFIKLREVSLSYSLPSMIIGSLPISAATVTFTGTNLWIDSNFSYLDPEGNLLGSSNAQGFYHMVVPGTKGYNFSLSLTL
jgi:TonB-linked SusC/RagA family outer membrane protein